MHASQHLPTKPPTEILITDIYSARTKTLSFLGKLDKIPITSGSATSDELDNTENYPYMTRTIPPDSAVALAMVKFYKNLGFTKVGIVYVDDPYGIAFKDAVVAAGIDEDIAVYGDFFQYQSATDKSMNDAFDTIISESSGTVNAWIGIVFDVDFDKLLFAAIERNAAGGDNVWVFSDGISKGDIERKSRGGSEYLSDDVIDALRGSFRIVSSGGSVTQAGNTPFDLYESEFMKLDEHVQYISYLREKALNYVSDGNPASDPFLPVGFDMASYPYKFFENASLSDYESFFFDTAIQTGMGACKAGTSSMTDGVSLHAAMSNVTFSGWTGSVIFDHVSGSRTPSSVR